MEKDRDQECKDVIRLLHGTGNNDGYLELEFTEIKDAIAADRIAQRNSWKSMIKNSRMRKRLLLGCGVQFFCQTSGLNVISYYGTFSLRFGGLSVFCS